MYKYLSDVHLHSQDVLVVCIKFVNADSNGTRGILNSVIHILPNYIIIDSVCRRYIVYVADI